MSQAKYEVVFSGKFLPDRDVDSIQKDMAALFKTDEARVADILKTPGKVIRRNLDEKKAEQYRVALGKIGVICTVRPEEDLITFDELQLEEGESESPSPASFGGASSEASIEEEMACPKCGHPQPKAEACVACGAIIAKVLAHQQGKFTRPTSWGRGGGLGTMDEIDYRIVGDDMQFVEIELDPNESAVAEAGAMMYKSPEIEMESVFGDASEESQSQGLFGKVLGAGKRLVTGEGLFTTVFCHTGRSPKAHVAFAAPFPGSIIPVHLKEMGGCLICQKDSFLCGAKGVSIGIHFQRKILTGLFGGEGFIMQKLEGDGVVFVHAGGTVVERTLERGEVLHVDTGCVVAMEPGVDFDIQSVAGIKTALFGGEGLFFATMRGPGRVWLQSLPFSRVAGRMLSAASSGANKGEGSILGSIGDLIDGDGFKL